MLGNSPQPAGKGGPPARARGRSRATDCKPPGRPRATFRAAPSSAFSPAQRAREGPGHAPATPPRCPAPVRPAAAGGGGGIGRGAATAERRAATSPPRRPDGGDAGSFGRASKSRGGADRGAHRLSSRPADILMDGMTRPTQASCGCAGLAWGQGWQTGSTAWVEEASSAGRRKGRREEVREGR